MTDIFDRIRESCADVAQRSTHVSINRDGLERFASTLDITPPQPDPGQIRIGDDESSAAFILALDSINFGSGYFPYMRKREGMSGYHTVATSLRDFVAEGGPITVSRLVEMDPGRCAAVFGQSIDEPMQAELMSLFSQALLDLAHFVTTNGNGSFLNVIDSVHGSAAAMVELLDRMPFFHDVHSHGGAEVLLFKRAQIVVQDLAVAFQHEGPGRFHDIDRLTMFADNLVPHVLRVEGVLEFAPELLARIERVDDITVGSDPEVEIRACALHAVELLRDALVERGVGISSADLDNILWNLGAAPRYKSVLRHRSRCVFY